MPVHQPGIIFPEHRDGSLTKIKMMEISCGIWASGHLPHIFLYKPGKLQGPVSRISIKPGSRLAFHEQTLPVSKQFQGPLPCIPVPAVQVHHLPELERTRINRGLPESCIFNKCIGIEFIDLQKTGFGLKKDNDKFMILLPFIKDRDIPFICSIVGNPKKALYRLIGCHEIYRVGSQFPELYATIPGTRKYMAHVSGQDITGYPIRICGTRQGCSGMVMSAGMAERRETELHGNSPVYIL
jgi:hypothetical protein